MTTALVLYERYAVDDPVLDCAIQIVLTNELREQNKFDAIVHDWQSMDATWLHNDWWLLMLSLEHARDNCKLCGRVGYIWVDEGWQRAYYILDACSRLAFAEYRLQKVISES